MQCAQKRSLTRKKNVCQKNISKKFERSHDRNNSYLLINKSGIDAVEKPKRFMRVPVRCTRAHAVSDADAQR